MDEKPQAPPAIMLRQLAYVMRASRALYAAAELGIADILAAGPMTSEEIGAKAGANGPTVCADSCGRSSRTASSKSRSPAASASTRPVNCCVATFPAPNAPPCCSWPGRCAGSFGRTSSKACAPGRRRSSAPSARRSSSATRKLRRSGVVQRRECLAQRRPLGSAHGGLRLRIIPPPRRHRRRDGAPHRRHPCSPPQHARDTVRSP